MAMTMLNDRTSLLTHLVSRRSGKPRDLVAPGPDMEQMREMVGLAMRTPDHGKLAPWRFVIVPEDQRPAFEMLIVNAYRAEKPEAGRLEIEAMQQFARQAPALIVALSSPRQSHIPFWEQELSAGAATMNLLHAAHALGFAAGWLTGWAAYNSTVRDAFGSGDERIVGFLFIGTPARELDERPRPELNAVFSVWQGKA